MFSDHKVAPYKLVNRNTPQNFDFNFRCSKFVISSEIQPQHKIWSLQCGLPYTLKSHANLNRGRIQTTNFIHSSCTRWESSPQSFNWDSSDCNARPTPICNSPGINVFLWHIPPIWCWLHTEKGPCLLPCMQLRDEQWILNGESTWFKGGKDNSEEKGTSKMGTEYKYDWGSERAIFILFSAQSQEEITTNTR